MDEYYDLSGGIPPSYRPRVARSAALDTPTRIDWLLRRRELLDAEIARLETQPVDEYDVGAVLIFDKTFGNRNRGYNYAVIKAGNGLWYLTGKEMVGRTWEELLVFIHDKEHQPVQVYWAVNAEPVFTA